MRKYAIGLATAVLFGTGAFQQASAGDVLIPYIKSGGNWVSLVSYRTTCPNYGGDPANCPTIIPGSPPTPSNKLHFVYWYKKDWDGFTKIADSNTNAADGSYDDAACKEYNVEVPATRADFTTIDVSISNKLGLTDNVLGKKEGYDGAAVNGAPTAPTNADFVLEPDAVVDAYLVIQDGNTNTADTNTINSDNFLAAEAVVFDMITGMFFYQFGIDMEGIANPPGSPISPFRPTTSTVMFQGESFATTSVYYIPTDTTSSATAINGIVEDKKSGCVAPGEGFDVTYTVFDRQEDSKSGLNEICVNCLALIPIKAFMSDSTWNKVKNGGGWLYVRDQGGVTYKGEVFKIGTKPNIFAPLKSYANSLALD